MDIGTEDDQHFYKGKSHKRNFEYGNKYENRSGKFEYGNKYESKRGKFEYGNRYENKKHYRNNDESQEFGHFGYSQSECSYQDDTRFTPVQKPEKPRKYTISIAVPASILDATSVKDELRTYVVGQIARAAVIYAVDEIIVYDDGCWTNKGSSMEDQANSQLSLDKMRVLLEYQELPPYLRKYFFGFDKQLRCVGVLNPLNSSHHLKANEWCDYREGVVLPKTKNQKSYVDVGLPRNILINEKLESGLRVTVKLPLVAQEMDNFSSHSYGSVVPPEEPRVKGGYYWGYSVRIAKSLSEVVTGNNYPEGYDLIIGTSDKGEDAQKIKYPKFTHALIVFGGVEGLEAAIKADKQLQASNPNDLFHFYVNTCTNQQVRTIRTEEAILISMCVLHRKLSSKGIS
ncbi:hypothetical protein SK128_022281 [Halocaridina rubra]|uniref:RNA methyltransferase n=1 Tax=Halocaridina rubra TaxID=373956 RepID=A0AAN8XFC8_HALRR